MNMLICFWYFNFVKINYMGDKILRKIISYKVVLLCIFDFMIFLCNVEYLIIDFIVYSF